MTESSDKPESTPGMPQGSQGQPQPPVPGGYPPPMQPPMQPPQPGFQPGPYPGAYPPPPPPPPYPGYAPPPTGAKNGMGIAALVIAIIGLVTSASVVLGIVLGLVAVILGFIARGRVKSGEANNGGIALTGIVLGFLSIVAGVVFIFIWVTAFQEVGGQDFVECMNSAGSDTSAQQKCVEQFERSIEDRFDVTLTPTP